MRVPKWVLPGDPKHIKVWELYDLTRDFSQAEAGPKEGIFVGEMLPPPCCLESHFQFIGVVLVSSSKSMLEKYLLTLFPVLVLFA